MDKIKIKYRKLNKKKYENKFEDIIKADEESAYDNLVFLQEESQNFLLNNILMSFQFFYNYEREIVTLRENWFKTVSLDKHHKQCFYADSLHRLIASNVKFRRRHGENKNQEEFLHPFRIFISNDNIKAAFDPSVLDRTRLKVNPNYLFKVKPCENEAKEKAGYVTLMEYKTVGSDSSNHPSVPSTPDDPNFLPDFLRRHDHFERHATNLQRKSTFDLKGRRLTRTEKMVAFQNKDSKPYKTENNDRRNSLNVTFDGLIPYNCFYKYIKPSERITPKKIIDFKMNNFNQSSYILPKKCFQNVLVKQLLENGRREGFNKIHANDCITTTNILNSAAFMGNFCDNLTDKLAENLNFDYHCLNDSFLHEEFVVVNEKGLVTCITPTIEILDWDSFIKIHQESKGLTMSSQITWPTAQMKKILRLLPCDLVPRCHWVPMEDNDDYEKEWKIEFVRGEEYLLLHMMHSHLRCFLFTLAIYKSFIEKEINTASFNSRHILHHLLWKVHKNFLYWPEDKPGETLLSFLRSLYRKIQNKSLRHFFITSRNLFAPSQPKDLHKVQSIIKMILSDPVPFVMKSIKNLKLEEEFYQPFQVEKLNKILKNFNKPIQERKKIKVKKPKNEKKKVTFEDDKELLWRKKVIKQIKMERMMQEQNNPKQSVDSIDTQDSPQLNFNTPSGQHLIELFIFHFVEMGLKSIEYDALNQAMMYLFQTQKLLEFFPVEKFEQSKLQNLNHNISKLKENCDKLKKKFNYNEMNADFNQEPNTSDLNLKSHKNNQNSEIRKSFEPREIKIINSTETLDEKDEEVEDEPKSENEDDKTFSTYL